MESSALGPVSGNQSGLSAAAPNAALGREAFLNLFVAQLRNQNPLEPQGNEEFLAQLAQFSSLELLENVSSGFDTLGSLQVVSQASALLGKDVRYIEPTTGEEKLGRVRSVRLEGGAPILSVGEDRISYGSVQEILEPAEGDSDPA